MRYFVALVFTVTLAGQTPPVLGDAEVDRLEAVVAKNPADENANVELLRRYVGLINNPNAPIGAVLEARRKRILWLIEHSPESRALAGSNASIGRSGLAADPEGYAKAAELWRQQANRPGATAKTIANAAYFFLAWERPFSFELLNAGLKSHPGDPDLLRVHGVLDAAVVAAANVMLPAGKTPNQRNSDDAHSARNEIETTSSAQLVAAAAEWLLQAYAGRPSIEDPLELAEKWATRARELEPANPGRTDFLISVLQRESNASLDPREKARHLEKALALASTDPQRIRVLLALANLEYEARDDAAAERTARQLLDLAAANPKMGNRDELVNTAHMVLGRVALARGENDEAKNQLLESARVKGSPELRNAGPKLLLAQDLLDAGDREAVLQYLDLCRAFWTNDQGKLDRLTKSVRSGGKDLVAATLAQSAPGGPPKRPPLASPAQLNPKNGAVVDLDASRRITLNWTPVLGADSYVVEWDYRDAKGWQSERDKGLVRVIPTGDTTAALDFTGARQGRWRVYAVEARNGAGATSDWREFRSMETSDLPDRAAAELDAGDIDGAERDARRLLESANSNPKGSSHGDLSHAAQTLLGRVAIRRGDLKQAREHLLASARIENAPVSSSLGPSMKLAQELLAAGDRQAVLQYLELCRSFWKSDRGRLDHYVSLVKNDAAPNLLLPYSGQGPGFTGGRAPAFRLRDLAGATRSLEEFSGKPVVLDFWATWCVPCREELADVESLAKEFRSRGLTVIAVNVGENEATVRAFVNSHGITLPVLLAGEDEMVLGYRVTTLPVLAVVDRSGQIVDYRIGGVDKDDLRQALQLFTK